MNVNAGSVDEKISINLFAISKSRVATEARASGRVGRKQQRIFFQKDMGRHESLNWFIFFLGRFAISVQTCAIRNVRTVCRLSVMSLCLSQFVVVSRPRRSGVISRLCFPSQIGRLRAWENAKGSTFWFIAKSKAIKKKPTKPTQKPWCTQHEPKQLRKWQNTK